AVQPTVPMLDEATGAVPTVLIGGDAHHAWMNSAALRALGLPPRDGIVAEEDWFVLAPRLPELPGIADAVATGSAMMQRQAARRRGESAAGGGAGEGGTSEGVGRLGARLALRRSAVEVHGRGRQCGPGRAARGAGGAPRRTRTRQVPAPDRSGAREMVLRS